MGIDIQEKNLVRMEEWIRATDQKVGIFLAFQALILAPIFSSLIKFIPYIYCSYPEIYFILPTVGVGCLIMSVLISGGVIFPNLDNKEKKSILYFKDISEMDLNDYKEKTKKLTQEDYEDLLIEQTYVLSGIATKKQKEFQKATYAFIFGILSLAIFILLIL